MAEGSSETAQVVDSEPGCEVRFCPVRNMPIARGQCVRTLPGYHLLSLAAGREGLARGSYQAYGETFVCNDLQYLHKDDRIFVCAEDHKAFLNQMSMQYHRYINHELGERKKERKRLRERAVERMARSAAHAQAQLRQQQERQHADGPAIIDPYLAGARAGEEAEADEDPYFTSAAADTATSGGIGAGVEVPHAERGAAQAGSSGAGKTLVAGARATGVAAPLGAQPSAVAVEAPAVAVAATQSRAPALAPARKPVMAVAADDEDEEDLYGDVSGEATKRQKTTSTYATAIGAMLDGDFDDDE
eukprot:TRINITY_DN63522_c0_g1_i1.p1 TRINITY_DN63522_c0_g1~~TRINITY_DN63522_c0_g1_i1.p1  ORF type:complete len:328 (-),score=77.47 TRINITY_DN63522_c0_g1_i1:73-981(-)